MSTLRFPPTTVPSKCIVAGCQNTAARGGKAMFCERCSEELDASAERERKAIYEVREINEQVRKRMRARRIRRAWEVFIVIAAFVIMAMYVLGYEPVVPRGETMEPM